MSWVVSWFAINLVWLAFWLVCRCAFHMGLNLWLQISRGQLWIFPCAPFSDCRFLTVPKNLYWISHQRFPRRGLWCCIGVRGVWFLFWFWLLECACMAPLITCMWFWTIGSQGHPVTSDSTAACIYHIRPWRSMTLYYGCCFPLLWPLLRLHSHLVTWFERRQFSGTVSVIMVLLLVLSLLKASLYFLGVICLRFQ